MYFSFVVLAPFFNFILRTFKNTMCRKDGATDTDRSQHMAYCEGLTVKYLQFLRTSISDKYAYQSDPNMWINEYVAEIVSLNELDLRDARQYLAGTSEPKGSSEWFEMIHGWRRLIALRHQERELILQGLDIPLLARQSNTSIAQGVWSVPHCVTLFWLGG